AEFDRTVAGDPRRDVVAEVLAYLQRILALDQAEGDLGRGLRRDHRLRALADIAADNAVDVAGRARGDLLDQEAIRLAGRDRQPDRLQERFRRQIEGLPLRQDVRRQILHAIIETGNRDVAVVIEQPAQD